MNMKGTHVMSTVAGELNPVSAGARDATGTLNRTQPHWLRQLRRSGAEYFNTYGFPTTRDELWRQTNVSVLDQIEFMQPSRDTYRVGRQDIADLPLVSEEMYGVVFINGWYSAECSKLSGLPEGISVGSLSQAIRQEGDRVKQHLGHYAAIGSDAFIALNTAYLSDGVYIHLSRNCRLDKPLHLLFVTHDGCDPSSQSMMTYPRILLVAEAGSSCHMIQHHANTAGGSHLTDAVTEIAVGEEASVYHYHIENEGREAYHLSSVHVYQSRGSRFESHSILSGGRLVRSAAEPVLAGEGSYSLLNGVYIPSGDQHMANHMRVHHVSPGCDSRQYYNGIMNDRATGVFIGRIVVDRGAQKTDAKQSSRNLLLTKDSFAHARPQLEIFADDVKCTHGVTVGELESEAIFYLQSRGLSELDARAILIRAFMSETLDRIKCDAVREYAEAMLLRKLELNGTSRSTHS